MLEIVVQIDDVQPGAAMDLSDELAAVQGIDSVTDISPSNKSKFGVGALAIGWLVVVATSHGALVIGRVVYELRKRFTHGVIVDLSGEKPVITSLRGRSVANGIVIVKAPDGTQVKVKEAEELKGIDSIIGSLLKKFPEA
ncbi:MAG: hypothetical protein P4L48_23200 [Mycobacterium sp.]|nr:hypothetical protein [Mycobacterium sp.]